MKTAYLFLLSFLFLNILSASPSDQKQEIYVNIPTYKLVLKEGGREILQVPCYVGKANTPTYTGKGYITDKRPEINFYYQIGEHKGKRIEQSFLIPEDRWISMPYDRMRGLGMNIDGHTSQVIHSTTNYWKVGTSSSNGCIGLNIEDMLLLYEKLNMESSPTVQLDYQTLIYHPEDKSLSLYADIYNMGSNTVPHLLNELDRNKLNTKNLDLKTLALNLKLIDEQLRIRIPTHKKYLEKGLNVEASQLSPSVRKNLSEIFTAPTRSEKVFTGKIQQGKSLYQTLLNEGWAPSETMKLIHQLQELINVDKLYPEDLFMIKTREGVVTDFTLVHKGLATHLDLINNRLENTKESL